MAAKPLNPIAVTIPPASATGPGMKKANYSGGFLLVTAATNDFQLQFDTGSQFDCYEGFQFSQNFNTLTLFNYSANPIVVNAIVGIAGVSYTAVNQKEAATYSKGNLGCNSVANVTTLTGGAVSSQGIQLVNRGAGYKVGDQIPVTGGTYSIQATVTVQSIGSNGSVNGLVLTNPGSYTVLPTNTNALAGGSGAGLTVNFNYIASVAGLSFDGTNDCLILATASDVFVNNFDGANRRKQIIFQVLNILTGGHPSSSLVVSDANGNVCQRIAPGQTIGLDTSSQLYLSSLGEGALSGGSANCEFCVWETYYSPF